jgi:surface polysaccharide O-acyltransferase-like enzyme
MLKGENVIIKEVKKCATHPEFQKKRIYYFDLLRTVAIFFVVIIHCTAAHFETLSPESRSWLVANLFESISRWAVPVFIMISGALLLGKKRDLSTFFKKNVLKIAIILVSWNFIYGVVSLINGSSLSDFIYNVIAGHYHLWFLYMLLGLYILTPYIRRFLKDSERLELFLLISFIFGIALPELVDVMAALSPRLTSVRSGLEHALELIGFGRLLGYSFYFVLGYYLHRKKLRKKQKWFYLAGVIGLLLTFFATWCLSIIVGSPSVVFLKDLTINNVLMSAGVFVFC